MAIQYWCRHCGVEVGKLEQEQFDSAKLGFSLLDSAERTSMIKYDTVGNMHVHTICEDCQEALDRYPQFHEHDTFIQ